MEFLAYLFDFEIFVLRVSFITKLQLLNSKIKLALIHDNRGLKPGSRVKTCIAMLTFIRVFHFDLLVGNL